MNVSVNNYNSYNKIFKINKINKKKCIHCLKFKVTKPVKCYMCDGNICYDTECRLYFDFYSKQYLCLDCTYIVDSTI